MIVYAIIERQSGQAASGVYGQNVGAMGVDTLDHHLPDAAVTPISQFMYEDLATLEQALEVAQPQEKFPLQRRLAVLRERPLWHDPQEGLQTVRALQEGLPDEPRYDGVRADLRMYEQILEDAAQAGDRFRLNVATGD